MEGKSENGRRQFMLVRGYVLLGVGVLLILYSLIGYVKPAVLTLGGAILGIDPLLRSAQ